MFGIWGLHIGPRATIDLCSGTKWDLGKIAGAAGVAGGGRQVTTELPLQSRISEFNQYSLPFVC